MSLVDFVKCLIGGFFLLFGIYLFSYILRKTLDGYRSDIGTDVKGYAFAIMTIMLGTYLIYISIFQLN
jgi:hypothetical protein